MQVKASVAAVLAHIVVIIIILKLILLYYLVHKLLKEIHESDLISRQHVLLVLGNFEHDCGDSVTPLVKKVLLVLLHVHQFVHDVQFHVELSPVDCVLCWIVKMILYASRCELINVIQLFLLFFFFRTEAIIIVFFVEQIDHLCRHEVLREVEAHLVRCAGPKFLPVTLGLLVVGPVPMFVHSIVESDILKLAIDFNVCRHRSVKMDG